jgi:hypothetical protein
MSRPVRPPPRTSPYNPIFSGTIRLIRLSPDQRTGRDGLLGTLGSSAAGLAHASAFSFPGTPLYAGRHRTSMMIPGLALHGAATYLLPRLDRVHLAGARFPRCHAPDGGLGVGEDGSPVSSVALPRFPVAAHSASYASWLWPMWVLSASHSAMRPRTRLPHYRVVSHR